ncbi:ABC transporter ATP-binding protein [Moheibacter sediminis]|uniref:ATP-binding cassette, subfamily B, MsbA n=1 Tax=Moheibacter sediminis TaxID=1434700 RepID=A0A1W1ZS59_9FLAO|nr:ATP-binding cassette domain-containing protein [Moheibacter sediminis]SMC51227.1 ATP-binding cassette, subfamily B, MsbA [Moheibacter sediminis]
MSLFKRAIQYTKPYRSSFAIAIACNFMYAIFNVLALAFVMPTLNILFDEEKKDIIAKPIFSGDLMDLKDFASDYSAYYMNEIAIQSGPLQVLLISCIGFITLFFFRNIFSYLSEFFLIDLRSGVSKDFRVDIHNKILTLPVSYFTEKKRGDMLVRISSDVGEVEGNILNGLVEIIRSPIVIIVCVFTLFMISYQLTLFALLVFPIMGTIISIIGKSLKRDAGKAQIELGNIMSYVDETLNSLKIIKIFNAENQIKKRFDNSINYFRKLLQKVMKKRALASPTSEFLGAITIGMIVFFGGKLSLEGNGLKGSEFIFYIATFYTLLDPIKRFSRSLSDIQKGQVSAQRIFEVLDTEVSIQDKPDSINFQEFKNQIEFRNVNFGYAEKTIIKDFNLTIKKGETIALVGHSGSGKSTLANLITRFYDVSEGEILIDGVNVRDIKLKEYRQLFGLVTQDSILFNDSVFNNIALGDENPSMENVKNAAMIANAEEFILKLPEQYNESVGESGGKLSGGQKQRLSIARAVYKNPPIMVLDEATSALDTQSEKLVQDALSKMMQNRTSLVIAHRLSTIMNADRIIVLEDGKIIESGNHNELLEKKGNYANLIQLQNVE